MTLEQRITAFCTEHNISDRARDFMLDTFEVGTSDEEFTYVMDAASLIFATIPETQVGKFLEVLVNARTVYSHATRTKVPQ